VKPTRLIVTRTLVADPSVRAILFARASLFASRRPGRVIHRRVL
jgi:hypothetical protein